MARRFAGASRPDPTVKMRVEESEKPKHIAQINFGLLSGADMVRMSHLRICNHELYQINTRIPTAYGCLDPRLGISDKKSVCQTCGKRLSDCAGHFGYLKLALPVFHIGYLKATLDVLHNICKTCSRVLLEDAKLRGFTKRMRDPMVGALFKVKLRKKITEMCRKVHVCPHCNATNGRVKHLKSVNSLKFLHEKYKGKHAEDDAQDFLESFTDALKSNPDMKPFVNRAQEDLSPLRVLELFRAIQEEDMDVLWADPEQGRPENLILTHMLVPPVCIRPSVAMEGGGGSTEDDLTAMLNEIIEINNAMTLALNNGSSMRNVMDSWDFLQVQVAAFMNGELPGLPPSSRPKKPMRGMCQRLKGKQGRFRGNLLGKRVDFSGRSVISPDPNLRIEQVGVPIRMAKVLTYPERVSEVNRSRLQTAVRNGPTYPGANSVFSQQSQTSKVLHYGDRNTVARNLQIGDVVERHLRDGDVCLFNRQPSLHKMSIMAHRAKVMPWRTLRFNECVCAPYNADFDGDEMNIHVPQTEEARAEAACLMDVRENIITPRSGEPLVSATQDFLTAAFVLTQRNIFMERDEFCNVVATIADAGEQIDLPPPAIIRPVKLWTGKQVVSMLLKCRRKDGLLVNLELEEGNYMGNKKDADGNPPPYESTKYMDANEGYVCFRNSELMCGNLGKKTLGGKKTGLVYTLVRHHSNLAAATFLNRLTKMCTRWLTNHGFSISIEDVTPSDTLTQQKQILIEDAYRRCDAKIAMFKAGTLELQPGCDAEQSLESDLNGILGKLRDSVGDMSVTQLPRHNAPRIMATCGSKGSTLNICQMVACVGQQNVNGARIAEGFVDRTLPIFQVKAKDPAAKGFVANSFFTGLSATEFFFHTMGGREGLVDTAVKTAETGYMQRRLMKVLEDLSVQYDSTVRTSKGDLVQFQFGDDGLDPAYMEPNHRPVEFSRLKMDVLAQLPCPGETPLTPTEFEQEVARILASDGFQSLPTSAAKFLQDVREFTDSVVAELRARFVSVGLSDAEPLDLPTFSSPARRDAWGKQAMVHGSKAWKQAGAVVVRNTTRMSRSQLREIMRRALAKYQRACVQPGEAVGAVGAHSLGEPATQMTLKTFHFAGVASMNVTLGVPRIKEIINASANISTPIIEAPLVTDNSEPAARIVKGRIEKTTLGEVVDAIEEVFDKQSCYLAIYLDEDTIQKLLLNVTAESVRAAILGTRSLKLSESDVSVAGPYQVVVLPPSSNFRGRGAPKTHMRGQHFFALQALKTMLPNVIVQGLSSVSRAVIAKKEGSSDRFKLIVEGYDFLRVMGTAGVDARNCQSNHIKEVEATLGIEAARVMIMSELEKTYSNYGIDIDKRHLMLLADVMTYRGEVLGITRFGIAKMKDSTLMLASFEKTPDHLFNAAVHSKVDQVAGVSECIIMGVPIPLGTGLFKLVHDPEVRNESADADMEGMGDYDDDADVAAAASTGVQMCGGVPPMRPLLFA